MTQGPQKGAVRPDRSDGPQGQMCSPAQGLCQLSAAASVLEDRGQAGTAKDQQAPWGSGNWRGVHALSAGLAAS